jgi:streptomycin 6-kinase
MPRTWLRGVPLPTGLVRRAEQDPDLQRWVDQLPGVLDGLRQHWELEVGAPYEPGGTCSWVAPATRRSGEPVVLKVGWRHVEARDEAEGLRVWGGRGTVRLLAEADAGPSTTAVLLEPCRPGTALRDLRTEPEQDEVVAGLLRRLWVEPPPGHAFRPLSGMCAMWADGVEARWAHRQPAHLDRGMVADGLATWRALAAGTATTLLCTDLHAGNVLAAEREPWLVIDPKPYVGDRTYDVLQHALNCPGRLAGGPLALVDRLAGLLDLDRDRLRSWLFARCVLGSLDAPALHAPARALAP